MASAVKSKSPSVRRIMREAQEIANSPSPDFTAAPLESDLFEWHFTVRGPPSSAYRRGIYHGRITLPPNYPLRPPNFRFVTPNGRFETNREICLSMSSHHEETWQPAWGIRTALVALRSFMETNAEGQVGGLTTTEDRRLMLAAESRSFKCPVCGQTNADIMAQCEEAARKADESGQSSNEVEVPPELQLGYKDELGKKAENPAGNNDSNTTPASAAAVPATARAASAGQAPRIVARSDSLDSETTALAEGFVPTTTQPAPPVTVAQQSMRARSGQGVPRPTGPAGGSENIALQQRAPRAQLEWIDSLIYIVATALLFMVIRTVMA